jgi:hypothetical protein
LLGISSGIMLAPHACITAEPLPSTRLLAFSYRLSSTS